MQLTQHFAKEEFELEGAMPDECVPIFGSLCKYVLEPIREHCGVSLFITSGYRSPAGNIAAGGAVHSQHIATASSCAADFKVSGLSDLRSVFDWIRLKSGLPIDELILEHVAHKDPISGEVVQMGHDIIHASYVAENPRRLAKEGASNNLTPYQTLTFNGPDEVEW